MEEIKEILNKMVEYLKNEINPFAIILFGSYSRNTQNKESDIDIAIKGNNIDLKKIYELKQKLEDISQKDVDLVDLDDISDVFRYEILMNGIKLLCQDDYKFDLYKLDMCREYLELNESRQDIIQRVKNGGSIYGKWSCHIK